MPSNPQFVREAQFLLWLQWVGLSTFGWLAGRLFVYEQQFAEDPFRQALITAALIGVFFGVAQWLTLRRYAGLDRPWQGVAWIAATTVGMTAGYALAQVIADRLPRDFTAAAVAGWLPGMLLGGLLGVTLGLLLGLAQWPLLRTRPLAPFWVLVNLIGWGIALTLSTFTPFGALANSVLAAATASALTGLWVAQLLAPH